MVAADNLLQWGILGRSVLAACLWGGLTMLVMGLLARRWQEDRRDEYFAALIERQHPELGDRLFNALQLGRGQDYGSPQIVGQIVSDASQATIDLEMEDCLDWTPVRRAGVATGIATLALCVYAFVFAPRFSNGLGRVLFPISDIQPYTSTIIDEDSIRPKDHTRFPEGTPITITVSVGGDVLPASARLARRQADGAWRESPMQPAQKFSATDQSRKFQFQIDETTSSFQFYVTAGDWAKSLVWQEPVSIGTAQVPNHSVPLLWKPKQVTYSPSHREKMPDTGRLLSYSGPINRKPRET